MASPAACTGPTPDYYVDGVGSSVLLDDAKNTELFNQLADGTYKAGTVGNLAEG